VPNPRHHTTRFHRGHLHAALQEHVPRDSVHLGKKVARAAATDDGVTLYFEDGTQAHGDLLIGADGIKSVSTEALFKKTKRRGLTAATENKAILYPRIQIEIHRQSLCEIHV
jgi:salicylate hydroxylase